jgi:hypothetical protein
MKRMQQQTEGFNVDSLQFIILSSASDCGETCVVTPMVLEVSGKLKLRDTEAFILVFSTIVVIHNFEYCKS